MHLCLNKQSKNVKTQSVSKFERLPPELLLTIGDFLDEPDRVIFSMTCGVSRRVVSGSLAHKKYNAAERVELSKRLEIDWPQLLTCRLCGSLFEWRTRALRDYKCPCYNTHCMTFAYHHDNKVRCWFYDDDANECMYPYHCGSGALHHKWRSWAPVQYPSVDGISFEVIDLISRYHEQGSHAGLPACFLDRSVILWDDVTQETRARWWNRQLVVHTRSIINRQPQYLIGRKVLAAMTVCTHGLASRIGVYGLLLRRPKSKEETTQDIPVLKCQFCPCDARVTWQDLDDGQVRVIVDCWKNYGNSQVHDLAYQQMSPGTLRWESSKAVVRQRDLSKCFDTGDEAYGSGKKANGHSWHHVSFGDGFMDSLFAA